MSHIVLLTPDAEFDLARLEEFLLDRNPAAGLRAATAIVTAIETLSSYPDRGAPGIRPGVRRLFVPFGQSAYIIEYRVDPGKVVVARIFHSLEDRPLA